MSEDYNPFLDDSSTPQEEEFTHVTGSRPSAPSLENGAASKDSYSENVCISSVASQTRFFIIALIFVYALCCSRLTLTIGVG